MASTIPGQWRVSELIPLKKEGDCEVASNNRPLSLLAVASNSEQFILYLAERLIFDSMETLNMQYIGYFTVARKYGFYVRVATTMSHE